MSDEQRCKPEALKLFADYWVLRIVEELNISPGSRFSALERELDISPVTLSSRLRRLEERGLITRLEESRASVTYSLTERGETVLPVIRAISDVAS